MEKTISIFSSVDLKNKNELFKFISNKAYELKIVKNKNDFYNALIDREKVGSTGLENHIAIPHAISEKVFKQHIFVISLKKEIEYETLDGTKIKSVICLAVPKSKENLHIDVLQKVSTMLLEKNNQDILNDGNKSKIQNLFNQINKVDKIQIQENSKENKEILFNENKKHKELDKIDNLISLKKQLKKEYKANYNNEIYEKIKIVNKDINNCKLEINSLRNELYQKNNIDLKKEYKANLLKINKLISEEKKNLKEKLSLLDKDHKRNVLNLKNNLSKNDYKKELINENISVYKQKAEICSNLNNLNIQKSELIKKYKDDLKINKHFYIEKMNVNKFKITNQNNFFTKYINNIQLMLMIIMFIIALWAIVLGTFGISTNSSFLIENIKPLLSDISTQENTQMYNNAFNYWSKIYVSNNYVLSLLTLIFGVISMVLLIPLKIFKMSNIYLEKYSKSFFFISIIIVTLLLVITIISFENVNRYITFQENANKINESFSSLNIIKRPIKNANDFSSQSQYDAYIANLKNEFFKWTNTKFENINEWQTKALEEVKKVCKTNFDHIVLNNKNLFWL